MDHKLNEPKEIKIKTYHNQIVRSQKQRDKTAWEKQLIMYSGTLKSS